MKNSKYIRMSITLSNLIEKLPLKKVNDECTAEFKPVLKELPPEIEVKTGIEDDEEVFSHRGKLYRYARECNPAEWKKRGLGDIKILKTKNQVR